MPFEEGHNHGRGRKQGSTNKNTQAIRDAFQLLIENNLGRLQEDLDEVKPAERLKFMTEFAKFCLPTLKSIELEGEINKKERQPIIFIKK